ncbi:MAG: 16S rRNA (cytosine(1402)-N(4))-methyltransferase RsmH [Bacteroidetes bacterium]|jgi:16S rRNA (cytosine1402-N4)-methyltransferase|nr:16S rRNA (cytosine(1402)-N(4))-methyltransferase RsmH [Bacteroidota bacterium]MBT5529154.1 16S rRNA (cytosine(1402)-N(4))-methyltransferase RsmH [Cytophagia bacterium]MBT3421172.1 16S rRNA (cytosine(1402)-N(4))-methyltransferase RsmH [Bacteroidota bacterium]MBT3802283.1 16S rRNA (cytosine(1402)-N(4))-methyltransferase RsmH [Bacteroidota bacterium]MBT3933389.1 16S rRNA (cytosine(1402)-N(4))-methyltransferase RsmH [Bacteroidota bacterium]
MTETNDYHQPVLLNESIQGLNINPAGSYVDVTYGGGGHSSEILNQITSGKLIAFDKDKDAQQNTLNDKRFTLVQHDFSYMKNFLKYLNTIPVEGILADLGVSSYQFDTAQRGFSYRFEADLDMRMDQDSKQSAYNLLNESSEADLHKFFGMFGEVKNAKTLAKTIVESRKIKPIQTTSQLYTILEKCTHKNDHLPRYAGMVFQALRIKVNNELESLTRFLKQSEEVLTKGGRLVVITYHSLEDRLVKNFIKTGNVEGKVEKDMYGNFSTTLKAINRKPILPSKEEIEKNIRSRSAKLRIAEKI